MLLLIAFCFAASEVERSPNRPTLQSFAASRSHSLASLMVVSTASAQEGGSSELQLPTIDVTGDQGGYQATHQSINRLQTPLLNTPQTVNVVPQQEIQERRLSTMEDALRTVCPRAHRKRVNLAAW